jgi:hypothetical protein
VAAGDVRLYEFHGTDLDAREPIDAELSEAFLEIFINGFVDGEADEAFVNAIARPEVSRRFDGAIARNEQDEGEVKKFEARSARGWLVAQKGYGEIEFVAGDPRFELWLVSFAERDLEAFEALAHDSQHGWEMIAEDDLGGANADVLRFTAAKTRGDGLEVIKERSDELIKIFALRGELKGATGEERGPEEFLKLNDLPAHGRLLDAVRHVAHGFADAAELCHVIEQFEVMNVHLLDVSRDCCPSRGRKQVLLLIKTMEAKVLSIGGRDGAEPWSAQ